MSLVNVIIPAAGVGSRMQADQPKQYLPIEDKTILDHTLSVFLSNPHVDAVWVGISPDDQWVRQSIYIEHPKLNLYVGGAMRADTVLLGLQAVNAEGKVLVHDAARPLLSGDLLNRLLACSIAMDEGAILALPARDTVRQQVGDRTKTLDRSAIWLAQTPQLFFARALRQSLEQALVNGTEITDEASAFELSGGKISLIESTPENFKITTPSDLAMARAIMAKRI